MSLLSAVFGSHDYRSYGVAETCGGSPGCWDCRDRTSRCYRGYVGLRLQAGQPADQALVRLRTMLAMLRLEMFESASFDGAPFDFLVVCVRLDDDRAKPLGLENFDVLRMLESTVETLAAECGVIAAPFTRDEIFAVDELLRR